MLKYLIPSFACFVTIFSVQADDLSLQEQALLAENNAKITQEAQEPNTRKRTRRSTRNRFSGSLPQTPANPNFTANAAWSDEETFTMTFWREPAGRLSHVALLRITPTPGEIPFICSPSFMAITQNEGHFQYYDSIHLHTGDDDSFCGNLLAPTTFVLDQWSFEENFVDTQAFTLIHDGVFETTQLNIPTLDKTFAPVVGDFEEAKQAGIQECVNNPNSGQTRLANRETQLINLSTRAPIQGGAGDVIAGFTLTGTGTQKVLIKGQSLEAGVDTQLSLRKFPSGEFINSNDDCQEASRFDEIPIYLIPTKLTDACLLVDLPAGTYTAILSAGTIKGIGIIGINLMEQ